MGLRINDLKYLVNNAISIDEYASKLENDAITVAFYVKELPAINELKNFIEKAFFNDISDAEISDDLTSDNMYILFVEFSRNQSFPKVLKTIIDSLFYITDIKDWGFKTIDLEKIIPITEKNLKKYVRLEKLKDIIEDADDYKL